VRYENAVPAERTYTQPRPDWLVEVELFGDMPARMTPSATLQVQWTAIPSARAVVHALSCYTRIGTIQIVRRLYG